MGIVRVAYLVMVSGWVAYTVRNPWFTAESLPVSYGARGAFGLNVASTSLGIMVAGLVVGFWTWARGDRRRDRFLHAVTCMTLGLLVGWLALVVFSTLSMGLALTEPLIVCGILGGGVVAGLVYAWWRWSPDSPRVPAPTRSRPVYDFVRFVLGFVVGIVLGALSFWLDWRFPTNVSVGEWGLREPNWWLAPLILLLGGAVATLAWRRGGRPFAAGVSVATWPVGLFGMLA